MTPFPVGEIFVVVIFYMDCWCLQLDAWCQVQVHFWHESSSIRNSQNLWAWRIFFILKKASNSLARPSPIEVVKLKCENCRAIFPTMTEMLLSKAKCSLVIIQRIALTNNILRLIHARHCTAVDKQWLSTAFSTSTERQPHVVVELTSIVIKWYEMSKCVSQEFKPMSVSVVIC